MKTKRVGWCRLTEELVLDKDILNVPYLRDDMDVYVEDSGNWLRWTPEAQGYGYVPFSDIPEVIKLAMVMLE